MDLDAKMQKRDFSKTKQFRAMVSIEDPLVDPYNPRWLRSAILKIDMTSCFSAEGGPIWIKFSRLVQNDTSTVVMWS